MGYEDEELWRALLTNRKLRSRFIRDLEVQSISTRSAEDLHVRRRDEELIPRSGHHTLQNSASSASW
jgi:hypothetical protein